MVIIRKIKNKIKSWFSPWSFFGSYILFPLKMTLRKMGFGNNYYKKIEEIKDKHIGQRCFIIATGPSLTLEDVNLLKNELTIGENSIFKLYEKMKWIPTYYAMTDPSLTSKIISSNNVDFDKFAEEKCIFSSVNINQIDCSKAIFVDCNWLDHVYHYGKSTKFKYNPDLRYGVYDCYSITQECVIYAMYMGCKDIYIIGADNNYLGKKQHFSSYAGETTIEYEQAVKMQTANDLGYEFINKIAEQNGVNLYNATRGGNIKCLKRVNLEDVLNAQKSD